MEYFTFHPKIHDSENTRDDTRVTCKKNKFGQQPLVILVVCLPRETEDTLSRSGGNHGGRCGSSLYQVVQPITKEGHPPLWITTENDTEEDEKTVSVLFVIFLFPCLFFVFFFFLSSLNSDLILESS